jgi:hypothetical protein
MAYPYPIDLINSVQWNTKARTWGPHEIGGALYIFAPYWGSDDPVVIAYKSTDAGVSWSIVDEVGSPLLFDEEPDMNGMTTLKDGTNVIAAYIAPGGETQRPGDAYTIPQGKLAIATFDAATDTWGSPNVSSTTVYSRASSTEALYPTGGYPYDVDSPRVGFQNGNFINSNGWGLLSLIKRSSGELVFLVDDGWEAVINEVVEPDASHTFNGINYRRCSIVRYDGTWSAHMRAFPSLFVVHADYWPVGLVLGDDDDVHIFGQRVTYNEQTVYGTGIYAGQGPWYSISSHWSDLTNNAAVHQVLTSSNTLTDIEHISDSLQIRMYFSFGSVARVDDSVYASYTKTDATLVVASGAASDSEPTWTEEEVATSMGTYHDQEALIAWGTTPYLFYPEPDGTGTKWSKRESGTWTTPDALPTMSTYYNALLNGLAITDGIGLHYTGATEDNFGLSYYFFPIDGVTDSGPINRYRASAG